MVSPSPALVDPSAPQNAAPRVVAAAPAVIRAAPAPAAPVAAAVAAAQPAAAAHAPAPAAAAGPTSGPVAASLKVAGLPCGSCPGLCFYASDLPITLGRGPSHVQPWAYGDHIMLGPDQRTSSKHVVISFEPLSRTYELTVLGRRAVRVDGDEYKTGAVVRLGSGSCLRVGDCELVVLMPQAPRGPGPPPLPLPALPGAGGPAPPPLPLVDLALCALRSAPGGKLTVCEIEAWVRRVYPQVQSAAVGEARVKWRAALLAALEAQPPAVCAARSRVAGEPGAGPVWQLRMTPSGAVARAGAPSELPGVYTVLGPTAPAR